MTRGPKNRKTRRNIVTREQLFFVCFGFCLFVFVGGETRVMTVERERKRDKKYVKIATVGNMGKGGICRESYERKRLSAKKRNSNICCYSRI